ncbi:hypothetical protein Patl1_25279 [Pistacia atlantica]|uniref:Uncharacterized protein n=1 Tax=Pistacia atlantica TaxID=434234 RepID=A0ACC1B0T8_9ROSI|nr:hypothetical protein Patl1_25279 [Pistacia atlantica]
MCSRTHKTGRNKYLAIDHEIVTLMHIRSAYRNESLERFSELNMGNEMGNSNTSGLQEEENSTTQIQERFLQEAGHVDGAEGKNHVVPVSEVKDYNGKVNGLASDVPNGAGDSPKLNQTSDGREQEETEVNHPAESPKVDAESNEAGKDYNEKENAFTSDDLNGAEDAHFSEQIPDETELEDTEVDPPAECPKVEIEPNNEADGETSEIQTTSPSKDAEDDVKPPSLVADAEVENGIVPLAECQDYNDRGVNGLAFDVPEGAQDPHVANKISDEREEEDTKLDPPAEFQKVEVKPQNEADVETIDIKPTSPSTDSTPLEILQESILEENLPQQSDHQLLKQDSIKKDLTSTLVTEDEGGENATFDIITSSNDPPEPQESVDSKFDQPELTTIHADPPVEDSNMPSQKIEDILRSNLTCSGEENGQPIDSSIPKDIGESAVTASDPMVDVESDDLTVKEMASKAERLEIEGGDEISNGLDGNTMITSEFSCGVGNNCNGELPTEINPIRSGSPEVEIEDIFMDKSLNSHQQVSATTDDCIVLTEETVLIINEAEHGESKSNHYPNQSFEESIKRSNIDNVNVSTSEGMMIESKPEKNEKRTADYVSCDSGSNEDYIEEAQVTEDDHLVDVHINYQASVEPCKDSQNEDEVVPESGMVMKESSLTDCKTKEASEEKKMIEETEETTKASCIIGDDTEGRESQKQCESPTLPAEQNQAFLPTLPAEQNESFLPTSQLSLVQPQDSKQNCEKESDKIQSRNEYISEIKQEGLPKSFVTEASSFDSTNSMAETLVSVDQQVIEKSKQDLSQSAAETIAIVEESNTQANHLSGQGEIVETPAFATDDTQAPESTERLSTESNPDASNIRAQMQKSPSFDLDLQIEARTEESDQTPLLYREKTAIEDFSSQADVSLAYTEYGQDKHVYHAMPVEEKVVTMERSESEKSKTPFLGFLKEEEEAHIKVTPQKHDSNNTAKKTNKEFLNLPTEEVASTSPKSKEKRKPRSFLFTNCMCCTTVIN